MPVSTLRSQEKTPPVSRPVLGTATNRVSRIQKQREESLKKKAAVEEEKKKVVTEKPKSILPKNSSSSSADTSEEKAKVVTTNPKPVLPKNSSSPSAHTSSLADSSCSGSNGGSKSSSKVKKKVNKMAKIVPDGLDSPPMKLPIKRCDWITPNSEPLHIKFHDEEWGVPVHDDRKLFELLILSQALGELTWSSILYKRDAFRITFQDFDPSSVAKIDEKTLLSLIQSGNTLLSEVKLRTIVENAKEFVKVQQELGSFSNYCWRFVNDRPIKSGHRYGRQVPAKTPKSEMMSKDLMRRGFRCVGPTVVYSFMQVAGLVNDHLSTCFRYNVCDGYAQHQLLNPPPQNNDTCEP